MFNYPSSTKVDKKFKITDLLKMIKVDKEIKTQTANILALTMTNALSQKTMNLLPSSEVNEIYVFRLELKTQTIPYEFLKALDKTIKFQVLFEIACENKVKFLTTYKLISDEKAIQIKTIESDWQDYEQKEISLVNNLTDVYKLMLTEIYNLPFRTSETIKQWFERMQELEHLEKEFNKNEKLLKTEKQPKMKFEYNEKLRQINKQIKEIKNEK